MLINFDEITENAVNNFKNGEKVFKHKAFSDENNKIMLGRLERGASIGLHTHENNSEIVYILEGKGKVLYDGEYINLQKGDCHYCPMGHEHSLINDKCDELVFFAVVGEHRQGLK